MNSLLSNLRRLCACPQFTPRLQSLLVPVAIFTSLKPNFTVVLSTCSCCTAAFRRRTKSTAAVMFSAATCTARSRAAIIPGAARGFVSSAARLSDRKFFVGGNWKCNGSVSKVCLLACDGFGADQGGVCRMRKAGVCCCKLSRGNGMYIFAATLYV